MISRKVLGFAFALMTLLTDVSAAESVESIIQKSVRANLGDWNAGPEYSNLETDREPKGGTKTFEDLMILGSPYQRLVAIDGKPLSPKQQQEEEQKFEQVTRERRNESEQDRAARIAKYEKDRQRDHLFMQQLTAAFNFHLVGKTMLNGYGVYELKAVPRPHYRPPNTDSQALTGMKGELWIDEKTYQWVKVEAQVIHRVSIHGFLAEVEPGTRFELEKMPVQDGIWLPKHYSMKARAKVLFLFKHTAQDDETYCKYRRLPSEVICASCR